LLLRHAKSSWSDSRLEDHDRPLNARGERDAPRMGAFLRRKRLIPDVIISSDAVRARLTAEAAAEAAGYQGTIAFDNRLYLAAPAEMIGVLRAVSDEHKTAMLVGHNPGLEQLVEQLTGEQQDMPTAALAHIQLPMMRWNDLALETHGSLVDLWRPKQLA
jgi:phosphohistidine phosphatase